MSELIFTGNDASYDDYGRLEVLKCGPFDYSFWGIPWFVPKDDSGNFDFDACCPFVGSMTLGGCVVIDPNDLKTGRGYGFGIRDKLENRSRTGHVTWNGSSFEGPGTDFVLDMAEHTSGQTPRIQFPLRFDGWSKTPEGNYIVAKVDPFDKKEWVQPWLGREINGEVQYQDSPSSHRYGGFKGKPETGGIVHACHFEEGVKYVVGQRRKAAPQARMKLEIVFNGDHFEITRVLK